MGGAVTPKIFNLDQASTGSIGLQLSGIGAIEMDSLLAGPAEVGSGDRVPTEAKYNIHFAQVVNPRSLLGENGYQWWLRCELNILLTGGSGDLGTILVPRLSQNHQLTNIDVRQPDAPVGRFVQGSIDARELLEKTFDQVDYVIHIAAWHGIHQVQKQKNTYDFWDLNVTGTFNVFEAAIRKDVKGIINISSTSVDEWPQVYGASKVLNEEIARTYAARHALPVITLRPRAFIPHWNKSVYKSYLEWVRWFWKGAVHISDVAQAVEKALNTLILGKPFPDNLTLVVDGAYEYSTEDLENWDLQGPGSTFKKYFPQYVSVAQQYALDIEAKPTILGSEEARSWIGYDPEYGLSNLLEDLELYGQAGPPISS